MSTFVAGAMEHKRKDREKKMNLYVGDISICECLCIEDDMQMQREEVTRIICAILPPLSINF